MLFSDKQIKDLAAPLSASHVKSRKQGGRYLSYIEGWWAIAEANRIFGFDQWNRETLEIKCVADAERTIGAGRDAGWGVTYTAKVRITVGGIVREGCGTGHGIDRDRGLAHESALKEAETDAMKRALMTFGNAFGLALYDKEQANVVDDTPPANAATKGVSAKSPPVDEFGLEAHPTMAKNAAEYVALAKNAMKTSKNLKDLQQWWGVEKANRDKYKLKPGEGPGLDLIIAYEDLKDAFKSETVGG
jgi:DNA recombination protein Rad52